MEPRAKAITKRPQLVSPALEVRGMDQKPDEASPGGLTKER
jgi:hypothetical protein